MPVRFTKGRQTAVALSRKQHNTTQHGFRSDKAPVVTMKMHRTDVLILALLASLLGNVYQATIGRAPSVQTTSPTPKSAAPTPLQTVTAISTPKEIEDYRNSSEFKTRIDPEVKALRELFAKEIHEQLGDGHTNRALVYFGSKYSREAIEIVTKELESKGWMVTATFTPDMLAVSARESATR